MDIVNSVATSYINKIKDATEKIPPKLVVRCLTYNHAPYIKDTLDGFILQKTEFPFIVIVHDDASSDGTPDIIKDYVAKYPDKIFPILEKDNQYSKMDGSLREVINSAVEVTNAPYVALCEGDDYWTDPLKLQKQVDFLESHPEYSMCCHRVDVLDENTSNIDTECSTIQDKDYEHSEIQATLTIPTCSVVMRTECIKNYPVDKDFIVGDNVLWATCRSFGKVRGFNDVMGVYRRVSTGWTAQTVHYDKKKYYDLQLKWIKHYDAMLRHFPNIEREVFDARIRDIMAFISYMDIIKFRSNFKQHFREFYGRYGNKYIGSIFKLGFRNIKRRLT